MTDNKIISLDPIPIKKVPYRRKGLGYEAELQFKISNVPLLYTIIRRLGFISYWIIKWIHGEKELERLAFEIPPEYLRESGK